MSVIITIIILGLVITVHEIGHFTAARASGVFVVEFALGMGPKIFSFKKGETIYSLRAVPIGGFCKMLGEDGDESDPRAFCNRPVRSRLLVLSAGSLMNFLLAFIVFFILILSTGLLLPAISDLLPGMPAENAGLLPGDKIIKLNGKNIFIYDDFRFMMADNGGKPVDITIKRGSETLAKTIVPSYSEENGGYLVGFRPVVKTGLFNRDETIPAAGFFESVAAAFFNIIFWIKYTFLSLLRLFTFNLSVNEIAGPIGLVQIVGATYTETRSAGISATFMTMANIAALISANLGVFNLLPLPALDGGRLVFVTIEGLRRKPLNREREGMVHFIGFAAFILLAVIIAFNDIRKFM